MLDHRRDRRAHDPLGSHSSVTWSLAAPAAVAVAFLLLPLSGLIVRAPWRSLPEILSDAGVFHALRLSLVCATSATACSLLLGVPLAWILARVDHRFEVGVEAATRDRRRGR